MKDLTKGKPSTLILAFALPIFFANLLQLTYSLVDTRIVGTFLGEDALAAVGATTTLSNLIVGFLQGLSGGFAIIIAQKFGAKDYKCEEIIRNVADHGYRNCNIFYGVRIVIFTADFKYTECSVRSDGNGEKLYFRDHRRACGNISL